MIRGTTSRAIAWTTCLALLGSSTGCNAIQRGAEGVARMAEAAGDALSAGPQEEQPAAQLIGGGDGENVAVAAPVANKGPSGIPPAPAATVGPTAPSWFQPSDGQWLSSAPFVMDLLISIDWSKYIPAASETELAERGEPAPNAPNVIVELLGANRFKVTLDGSWGVFTHQRDDEWCWAACAQMVNDYNRLTSPQIPIVDQETLVSYFKSGEENQAANVSTIMRAICLDLEEQHRERLVTIGAGVIVVGADRLVEDLSRGSMPIVGLNDGSGGHAVVAISVTYSWTRDGLQMSEMSQQVDKAGTAIGSLRSSVDRATGRASAGTRPLGIMGHAGTDVLAKLDDYYNKYAIETISFLDPWSEGEPVRTMSGEEFRLQCDFIMTREVALEILRPAESDSRRSLLPDGLDDRGKALAELLGGGQ